MNSTKSLFVLLFLVSFPFFSFSQSDTTVSNYRSPNRDKSVRAPIVYNVNTTLGGDNVESSLKIEIVGDNLQIFRKSNGQWNHQWYNWSSHPARSSHLYHGGTSYEVTSSTSIYVNGSLSGSNSSYYTTYSSLSYDRVDIDRIDNYNATVKFTKTDVLEALLTINYPAESDYINFTWHITNIGTSSLSDIRLYSGGDTYSYDDDYGYGYWDSDRNTVGCEKQVNGETVYVLLQSIEDPYQHESDHYSTVDSHVEGHALNGYVNSNTSHDNGVALEWRHPTLEPGDTWTIHSIEKYSNKDITDLVVTAPFNEYIYAGDTKNIVFNVKNNSLDPVDNISLEELIDLNGWNIDVISPNTTFSLAPDEEIDVIVELFCPVTEPEGTIAKATLIASANEEEANDRAYVEVRSNMPVLLNPPALQTVCSDTEPVMFTVGTENTDGFQWQINDGGVWIDLVDNTIYSGTNNDTLFILEAVGLINSEYRCIISNDYGEITSPFATIQPDGEAPIPHLTNIEAQIVQCEITLTPPTASDNCIDTVFATTDDPIYYNSNGTYEIEWVYEDEWGNTSTQSQVVIVNDTEMPIRDEVVLPTIVGDCSLEIEDFPTATDNCAGTIVGVPDIPIVFYEQGLYTITWSYDDGHGNVAVQTQQVYIEDNFAPVPDSLELDDVIAQCEVTYILPPSSTDGCEGKIDGITETTFPIRSTSQITWSFTDSQGNTSTQFQNVIIEDDTAPVLDSTFLTIITAECSVEEILPPTATDNCFGTVTASTDQVFPITESTTIIWKFEDYNGNISTQEQTVRIEDTYPPIPMLDTLSTLYEHCSANIEETPTAIDNCSGIILGYTDESLYYDTTGTFTVNWKYMDNNENLLIQQQVIVVSNDEPVVNTQNQTYHIEISTADEEVVIITPDDINNDSYDDCAIDTMYLDITEFTAEDEGDNTVVLTVIDNAGNISTKTAIVTIILDYELEFPNLITPDGNGKNDYWVINGIQDLEGYVLDIYNKLGEPVYHSENYDNTWDATYNGNPLPGGTYYYIFRTPVSKVTYSGFITVVR